VRSFEQFAAILARFVTAQKVLTDEDFGQESTPKLEFSATPAPLFQGTEIVMGANCSVKVYEVWPKTLRAAISCDNQTLRVDIHYD
jgi:hypothetical protein